jgi:formyltetrahydrofolate synthetase
LAGTPLDPAYKEEHLDFLEKGIPNLAHHIKNLKKFGVSVVVAINRFSTDTEKELELLRSKVRGISGVVGDCLVFGSWSG